MMYKKIKKIKEIGVNDTYDIAMKSPHNNFIANGIVVHNSPLSHRLMRDIMPDNFDELSAVSSLLRPGPLRMGMHTEFADRKHGRKIEGKDYEIPECIRDIVKNTYGVLCVIGDTLITTDQGLIKIKDIVNNKLNLKVLSESENGKIEWKEIEDWFNNGIKEAITLEFENGYSITCTPDHKIYTKNRGKVEAQNLNDEDEIIFEENYDST